MNRERNCLAKAIYEANDLLGQIEHSTTEGWDSEEERKNLTTTFYNLCDAIRRREVKVQALLSTAEAVVRVPDDLLITQLDQALKDLLEPDTLEGEVDPTEGLTSPYR